MSERSVAGLGSVVHVTSVANKSSGIWVMMRDLCAAQVSAGLSVHVIVPPGDSLHIPGVHEVRLRANSSTDAVRIMALVRRIRPQVVHAHTQAALMVGLVAARLAGSRCVFTGHNTWSLRAPIAVCAMADASVFVSEYALSAHLESVPARLRERIKGRSSVVYNGIDEGRLGETTSLRQQFGLEGRFVVGSLAGTSWRKGGDILVRAAATIPNDCAVVLVGGWDDKDRAGLYALAKEVGAADRIFFPGRIDNAAAAVREFDCLVVPSRTEGLGLVIIEAFASRVPVVASAVDGIPEIVHDGETGFLFPTEQPDQLARAVARLRGMDDADRTALLDRASTLYRERLTHTAMARAYDDVYGA